MQEDRARGTVVVLQRLQPVTTDLSLLAERVVLLTDGPPSRAVRVDAPAPREVVSRPRDEWPDAIRELGADGPVEVVTNDEFCLTDCAAIRHGMGLPRVTSAGLDGYVDKVVMKERLAAAGVVVPRWAPVPVGEPSGTEVPVYWESLAFPVVVKPRVGSNSRGVRVLRDEEAWQAWGRDRSGEEDWQVEEFVDGRMCFVDGLVVDGTYTPVLVGRYLGGLLPSPEVHLLGAVSVPQEDRMWGRAVALGRAVASALGDDGRFATHLEFFEREPDLVVMEVSARAPGALVSEMARVVTGANLETSHLRLQAGLPPVPVGAPVVVQRRGAAWLSVLARGDQAFIGPPELASAVSVVRMPAPPSSVGGRYVAAMALLVNEDHDRLETDVAACLEHRWYG